MEQKWAFPVGVKCKNRLANTVKLTVVKLTYTVSDFQMAKHQHMYTVFIYAHIEITDTYMISFPVP